MRPEGYNYSGNERAFAAVSSSRSVLDEFHFNSVDDIAAMVSSTLTPGLPSVPMPVLRSNISVSVQAISFLIA